MTTTGDTDATPLAADDADAARGGVVRGEWMPDVTNSDTYSAALDYARRGWSLVALHWITAANRCSCGVPGCKSAGKHPRDSAWQRSGNPPERWAPGHPGEMENIGVRTGTPSGIWVLDFDPADADDAGMRLYEQLQMAGLKPHIRTGGGGYHWRFALEPGQVVKNLQSAGGGYGRTHSLPMGWDVRGEGGQVVAPPSVSGKGAYVELDAGTHVAPAWLLQMVAPPDRMVSTDIPNGQPGGSGDRGGGTTSSTGEGSSHPTERVQAYCTAAMIAECDEYASLTDGRRAGETMGAFSRRLVELANLARWPLEAVYPHFEAAVSRATANRPDGGYAPHEIPQQWARACEHVGGRPAVMPPGPDVLEGMAPPFVGAGVAGPTGVSIVEPGDAPPSANGAAPVTGMTPGPEQQTFGPPPVMDPWTRAVAKEVYARDVREAAERFRAERDLGDPGAALLAMRAEIVDAKAIKLRPRLRPIVDGLLYRNTLNRINGASGDGKSLITLSLAAAVAAGEPWAGLRTHAGIVVCLVAEGEEGIADRVEAWEIQHGREFPSDVLFLPRPVQVMGPEWPILTATLAEIGPALVVGDTQARLTVGVNEIDNTELSQVVDRLDGLRVATGAAVLLVHHYGTKGDRGRGGTAITGALQTELGVRRTGHVIEVSNTKSKDDAQIKPLLFDLVAVAVPGVPNEHGFVEPGRTGAVAVFRNELSAEMLEEKREDEYVKRARKIWQIMHDALGVPGQTYAQIRDAFGEAIYWKGSRTGLNSAFTRAWALLIERGLVAYRKERFKIIELQDQGADGVLTANPEAGAGGVGVLDAAEWQLLTSGIDEKLAEERRKSKSS